MSFTSFGLNDALLRGVKDLGFTEPTPIQRDAIPPAMQDRDLLACAMTGSGKTAAFVLPIVHRLMEKRRGVTRALVLTPTRELAAQIDEHVKQLARFTQITSASVFGGVAIGPQERAFRSGADILVATPGRLLDHMRYPYARLDGLEYLVIDEADRMLDMGFLPDIRRILKTLPSKRQTLFFSATLPPPIAALSGEMLKNPVAINVERQSAPATGITHTVYSVPQTMKSPLLVHLLQKEEMQSVVVFTRTKHRANRLAAYIEGCGISCSRIHGNRSQSQRTLALSQFKKRQFRVLVATDIAARGIDVEALSHVVNFDVPHVADDYIHRVGRTARADMTGDAVTFVSSEEEADLKSIEKALGKRLPRLSAPALDGRTTPEQSPETPLAERVAAIRATRAEQRTRAEGNARRSQRPSPHHYGETGERPAQRSANTSQASGSRGAASGPSASVRERPAPSGNRAAEYGSRDAPQQARRRRPAS